MKKKMPPQAQSDRISALEKDIALSIQDRKQMRDDIHDIKESVKAFDEKLDTLMDKIENKFASKRTETAMKWLITIVMWAVVMWLMWLIITK